MGCTATAPRTDPWTSRPSPSPCPTRSSRISSPGVRNTRWPSEVVTDWSRGVPTAYARQLADHWTGVVRLAGPGGRAQRVPAVHGRDRRADGSTSSTCGRPSPARRPCSCCTATRARSSRRSRMIGPLVDPVAHGGRAEDAFHVVVPSLPGFGFSTPVTAPAGRSASPPSAFDRIMQALGYERYGVQRRRHRRRRGRAAVHPGRRSGHRLAGRHRSRRDRDRVHAADRPPDRGGEGAARGAEGGPGRGLRLHRGPDDPPAVDRLRADRLAGHAADLDRREVQGMDRPAKDAARGRGRPRPAADAGERLLVRQGRRRRRELPVRGGARRGRVGPDPRPAAGLRGLRRRAADPADPRSGRRRSPTGTSTRRAATSRRWRCRTCSSATCGRSSRGSAECAATSSVATPIGCRRSALRRERRDETAAAPAWHADARCQRRLRR